MSLLPFFALRNLYEVAIMDGLSQSSCAYGAYLWKHGSGQLKLLSRKGITPALMFCTARKN
eukprot:COSAG01_NODE_457_length_16751_cov_34.906918_13_plen_61_part_00